jgi:Calcineurin-like phosphoesterase
MISPNTDLLPPLFDQILAHYGEGAVGKFARADIVAALENAIVNAAANHVRANAKVPEYKLDNLPETIDLDTFDRLSGAHLSRAALSEELQASLSLGRLAIEIAILLVEAQIDLRLKAAPRFEFAGIAFERNSDQTGVSAGWCQNVLAPALRGSQSDAPKIWNRIGNHRPEGVRVLVESLQLSATLRDALPYTIKVEKRLVAPLVATARADKRIRLLHISDLHMSSDLVDPERGGSPTYWQAKHSFQAARMLGWAARGLSPPFDMLAATGDVTTDGSKASFEVVQQYIRSGPISGENKLRIAAFGLNTGKGQRVLLPGNHDRFDGGRIPQQRLSDSFEDALDTPRPYPYVRCFRPAGRTAEELTLLLFVFDSTLSHEDEKDISAAEKTARGHLKDEDIKGLLELSRHVAEQSCALDLNGAQMKFDPKNSIRIALLHHPPVASQESEERVAPTFLANPIAALSDRWRQTKEAASTLLGADKFLKACFSAGIQLVLSGHDHRAYQRLVVPIARDAGAEPKPQHPDDVTGVMSPFGLTRSLRTFCCPTTLEASGDENGFYVFDFMDKDKVSLGLYVSKRSGQETLTPFDRHVERSGEFNLSEVSDQDKAFAYKLPIDQLTIGRIGSGPPAAPST